MPLRWVIHSSDVSIICDRSSLVTTRSGTWNAVAMNSVRGIALPCGARVKTQDFARDPLKQGSSWISPSPASSSTPCGAPDTSPTASRSEEHTSELQSRPHLVCRLLLEKKKKRMRYYA